MLKNIKWEIPLLIESRRPARKYVKSSSDLIEKQYKFHVVTATDANIYLFLYFRFK